MSKECEVCVVDEIEEGMPTIKVSYDVCAENPREYDNHSSKMVCKHKRYDLGDDTFPNTRQDGEAIESWEEAEKEFLYYESLTAKDIISLPIYMYSHSNIALSTKPFSCNFDSGKVGFIYETKKSIREEFGVKRISPKLKQQILDRLHREVEVYGNYVNGDCYILDYDGEVTGGFIAGDTKELYESMSENVEEKDLPKLEEAIDDIDTEIEL